MSRARSIGSYRDIDSQRIGQITDPVELIGELFNKSCSLLLTSLSALDNSDDEAFQQSSLHALQIVLSLRFILDTSQGDELSASLYETYTAIAASLLRARSDKNPTSLQKIFEALEQFRLAWKEVKKSPAQG